MDKKKQKPILLFLFAFVAIVILTFIHNYRSTHVQEIYGPSAGVERLSTCDRQLVAISMDKEVYVWDWDDLSGRPQVGKIKAPKAAAMSSDRLVWVPSTTNNTVVVTNLKGDKELKRLPLPINRKCRLLKVSPNGQYAVAALEAGGLTDDVVKLVATDSDLTSILQVATKTIDDGLRLNDIGVSNDGSLIAVVGRKGGGWVLVADVQSRKILWERTIADVNELKNVVFSPDGQVVYASEPGRFAYAFEVVTGKLVKKFEMDKYKTPPNNPQTISCIVVSPDGRLLAVSTVPASRVFLWDTQTGKRLAVIHPDQFTVNGLAFSPDSLLLATGDLIGRVPMKVWRLSDTF
jgi:WD40 repeat protein